MVSRHEQAAARVLPGSVGDVDDLPLSTAPALRELFARLLDREQAAQLFRRELPPASDTPICVTSCDAKARFHRDFVRAGRIQIVYRVGLEVQGAAQREFVFLGAAPVTREYLGAQIQARSRALQGHPWVQPFGRRTWFVEELRLALLLFPLDPALPALAEITGSDGARVLGACLAAGLPHAQPARLHCELRRYSPLDRAVLRVQAEPAGEGAPGRAVYVKLFADESGASSYANLVALRAVTRGSSCLHVPEPLGYDPERRMLVLGEAPGQRDLNEWIKRVEHHEPLPSGVDLERLESCIQLVARALLELQGSALSPGTRRVFRDELAQLEKDRAFLPDLRASQPELVARAESLLQCLDALAPARERLVPSHGSFRHKQMLGDEHELTVIDWDGYCLANPALDAATFLGRLRREPVLHPGCAPELERMAGEFRRSFLLHQPESAGQLALYESLVFTEQMLRAFRRPGAADGKTDAIRCLATAAEALLAQAQAEGRSA